MRSPIDTRTSEHRAVTGARPCPTRIRASGTAAAPRADVRVLASGTHRTRVSEMRLAGARAGVWRPAIVAAGQDRRHVAMVSEWGDEVRRGTG